MNFVKAQRSRCKIKMALQGSSGSGKTYSALLIAFGLTKDWNKVAVIDTENGSAHLYSHLGPYSVLSLTPPFNPEMYAEAINVAVKHGFQCVVIDSISHEWDGSGGILDIHGNLQGNSFTNWNKITPRHNLFMQAILQSDIHVISTIRCKQDYVLNEKNGKLVPEKIGLKPVQRDGVDYEFTLVFELNQRHIANVTKDRTGIFKNKPEFTVTSETGAEIARWCESIDSGAVQSQLSQEIADFQERINACKNLNELHQLFLNSPQYQVPYSGAFEARKNDLKQESNFIQNGKYNH
jgi:hypothetical protein